MIKELSDPYVETLFQNQSSVINRKNAEVFGMVPTTNVFFSECTCPFALGGSTHFQVHGLSQYGFTNTFWLHTVGNGNCNLADGIWS